jgi:ketosteroid isomerase-like protein
VSIAGEETVVDATPATISAYFSAVNRRNWAAMPALFAEDAELRPVASKSRHGCAVVLDHYPLVLANSAEHHDEPIRVHVAGDVVVVEIAFEGRTVGGAEVTFDAVDVVDLAPHGRITRSSLWYDTRRVARQVAASGTSATI